MADLMLVDDDRETADLLAALLRDEGHDVRVAYDGREGLAQLKLRKPDLVLLDVEMPVMTGPEVAYSMFLFDTGLESIPIVLLSGVLDLKRTAAAVGTPYFIAKPCALEPLLGVVGKALVERLPPRPSLQAAARV